MLPHRAATNPPWLGEAELPGKPVLQGFHSCCAYGHRATGTSFQATPTREFSHCGVNSYTEEKELVPLLIAITPLLLSNPNRIKPRCRIQKRKTAKRQQKRK